MTDWLQSAAARLAKTAPRPTAKAANRSPELPTAVTAVPSPAILEASAADYTRADLAELHRLAARWHELVNWRSGTAETLAMLKRMASARVLIELAEWRQLVGEAEVGRE